MGPPALIFIRKTKVKQKIKTKPLIPKNRFLYVDINTNSTFIFKKNIFL